VLHKIVTVPPTHLLDMRLADALGYLCHAATATLDKEAFPIVLLKS